MPQKIPANSSDDETGSLTPLPKVDPKAIAESEEESVSEPGGFKNDPNDPTNPNEEIERYREKLRP